jgi:hypothetical protein
MRFLQLYGIAGLAIAAVSIMAGCAYAKKELIQVPCIISDTMSYAKDIAPIISTNCAGCHSTASNVSGILLDSYDGLKFWAQNGYLYGTISHAAGYKKMPDGGSKLSDCTIGTIKKWIDVGTPR